MSIKSKVLAATAALTLVGGFGAVAASSAGAATPSCGHDCLDLFSREFGTHAHPNFVQDVLQQGSSLGQPVILFRTSNSDPAEDFTVSFQGNTSDFYAAGLVSLAVALHYGCTTGFPGGTAPPQRCLPDDPAFEAEYAPYGVDSGLCVGVARTAFQNEKVSLQPCGVSAQDRLDPGHQRLARHHQARLRAADQRLGHELLAPVRADLPEERLPDRQAAAAAHGPEPDRFLARPRHPDRLRAGQPALGR